MVSDERETLIIDESGGDDLLNVPQDRSRWPLIQSFSSFVRLRYHSLF